MLKLLKNIEEGFWDIDTALKTFNKDVKANPTQVNIIRKLSPLNTLFAEKLREIEINMATFDIALKTQKIEKTNDGDVTDIEKSKVVVENTLSGVVKNINQLKRVEKNSLLGTGLTDLLKNSEEMKFLLEKHLEQYDTILDLLR